MRGATHRCGLETKVRQTDFPPRNRSIPRRPFTLILTLSLSLSLFISLLPISTFSLLSSLFLFRFSSHSFSHFTFVFVAFASPYFLLLFLCLSFSFFLSLSITPPFLHFTSLGPVQRWSVHGAVRSASSCTYEHARQSRVHRCRSQFKLNNTYVETVLR